MNKILIILSIICFSTGALAFITPVNNGTVVDTVNDKIYIMFNKATTGDGAVFGVYTPKRTFHATVTGTGAVTATVKIQVSNDGVTWIDLLVAPYIALSGTNTASDGFVMDAKWAYVKANVAAISGTNAKVTVYMGV